MARSLDIVREIGYGAGPDLWADDPAELVWPESVRTYDRMWRTEPQMATIVRAVTLPIASARWSLDPGGTRDEVAETLAMDLGLPIQGAGPLAPEPPDRRRRSLWTRHLPLALRMVVHGFAPFEMVYRVDDEGRLRIDDLGYRSPLSIDRIDYDARGRLVAVWQRGRWSTASYSPPLPADPVRLPASTLLYYTHDGEPGSILGTSILRAGYRPYRLKDRVTRLSAVAMERGVGAPVIVAPEGASQPELDGLSDMAQAYRGGERAGGAVPAGTQVIWPTADAAVLGQARDYIAGYDAEIAMMVLAQALSLGFSREGSRALSGTFMDFFHLTLQALVEQVRSTADDHLIARTVALTWGEDEPAPSLAVAAANLESGIAAPDIAALVDAGAVTLDDGLRRWLRERYRMPDAGPATQP